MSIKEEQDKKFVFNTEDYKYNCKKRSKVIAYPTKNDESVLNREQAAVLFEQATIKLQELQTKLYAQGEYALLVIIQGLDASGKDGVVKKVMSNINPQGFTVSSFKSPTEEELSHDYMWRCIKELPKRGQIALFNRSYYEEVLYVRVHENILKKQNLPGFSSAMHKSEKFWDVRLNDINNFEEYFNNNGIHVIKIFLNISKEEQKARFLRRIDFPEKNYKFAMSDIQDRKQWDFYMQIYEKTFKTTSSKNAPWYLVPADNKWFVRLIVSNLIIDKLSKLSLSYPILNDKRKAQLEEARHILENED